MNLVILGAGSFAREVYHHLADSKNNYTVSFYDDTPDSMDTIFGSPVIDNPKKLSKLSSDHKFIVGVGNPDTKQSLVKIALKSGIKPAPAYVHEKSLVQDAELGLGGVVCPNTVITTNVKVRDFTLNLGVTIGHDSVIGEYTNVSPGLIFLGIAIGNKCDLGTNSSIIPNLKIADSTIIRAGACLTKTITESGVYVGIPAKKLNHNSIAFAIICTTFSRISHSFRMYG